MPLNDKKSAQVYFFIGNNDGKRYRDMNIQIFGKAKCFDTKRRSVISRNAE